MSYSRKTWRFIHLSVQWPPPKCSRYGASLCKLQRGFKFMPARTPRGWAECRKSTGILDARAGFRASMSPLDPPLLNPGIRVESCCGMIPAAVDGAVDTLAVVDKTVVDGHAVWKYFFLGP